MKMDEPMKTGHWSSLCNRVPLDTQKVTYLDTGALSLGCLPEKGHKAMDIFRMVVGEGGQPIS